jgi:hypothetical protein
MKSSAPLNGPLGVLGPIELAEFREYLDAGALGLVVSCLANIWSEREGLSLAKRSVP